jgi:hypothetical protein
MLVRVGLTVALPVLLRLGLKVAALLAPQIRAEITGKVDFVLPSRITS